MLNRCDKCGGLVSGRYHGFEAVCNCFTKSKKKRKQIFHHKDLLRSTDSEEVSEIVKGTIGVDPD